MISSATGEGGAAHFANGAWFEGYGPIEGTAPFTFIDGPLNRLVDYVGNALDPRDGSMWMVGTYAHTSSLAGTWVGHLVFQSR